MYIQLTITFKNYSGKNINNNIVKLTLALINLLKFMFSKIISLYL